MSLIIDLMHGNPQTHTLRKTHAEDQNRKMQGIIKMSPHNTVRFNWTQLFISQSGITPGHRGQNNDFASMYCIYNGAADMMFTSDVANSQITHKYKEIIVNQS